MDDLSTVPELFLELDNLRAAARWARAAKNGMLLGRLATTPRNWLYNIFRVNEEWLGWLTSARSIGIPDKGLEANVLKAIGDVQQFRDEREAALDSYAQALTLFRTVGARLGEANVLKALGLESVSQQDFDQGLKYYQQSQQLYEQIGDRYSQSVNLAQTAIAQWQLEQKTAAVDSFARAARLADAIGVEALRQYMLERLAEMSKEQSEWSVLTTLVQELVTLHPDDPGLRYAHANALYEQKEYDQALAEFRRLVELAPDDPTAWNGLANTLESLDLNPEAIDAYSHSIELTPDQAYLYRNRANIELESSRLDEAERDISKAVELQPDHPYTHARQGYLALARGRFEEAETHLAFASENDDTAGWKLGLALARLGTGNADGARQLAAEAMTRADKDDRASAIKWLERMVKLNPDLQSEVLQDMLSSP
ncbi:MAG: tetratricopeptide repeat protein [Anaerolineae bacterium]